MEQENANFESSPLQQEMIWEQKVEEISQEHEDRATKDLTERKKKFQTVQMPHYKGVNAQSRKGLSQQGKNPWTIFFTLG